MEYMLCLNILFWILGVAISCEDGWVSRLDHCYLFVNDTKLDWFSAEAACKQHKAELLYIDTQEELAWLQKELSAHWSYEYWTGLNTPPFDVTLLLRNGQWTWGTYGVVDSTLINSPSFWYRSPTFSSGHPQCYGINSQGKMEGLNCNSTHYYACRIEWKGDGSCPLGWYVTDRGCLYLSSPDQHLTWAQAKEKCEELDLANGTHLLTINNVEIAGTLKLLLPTLNIKTHVFWTGLTTKGDKLVWENGESYQPSLVKFEVEPDYVASQEKCGSLRFNGRFSDRDCTWRFNYICKL